MKKSTSNTTSKFSPMNCKSILLPLFILLFSYTTYAQVIGSRENNSPSPRTVEAADITSSNYSGDVNVFNETEGLQEEVNQFHPLG